MSKEPKEYLLHIFDECEFILNSTKELTKEDFVHDETLK
jgi:uncharacterized protein with HEPN domain